MAEWAQKLQELAGEFNDETSNGKLDKGKWIQKAVKVANEMTDDLETDDAKKDKRKHMICQAESVASKIFGFDPGEEDSSDEDEKPSKPSSSSSQSSKPPKKKPPSGKPSYLTPKKNSEPPENENSDNDGFEDDDDDDDDNDDKPQEEEEEASEQKKKKKKKPHNKSKNRPPAGKPSYLVAKIDPESDAQSTKEDVKEQQKQDAKIDGLDDNDTNDTVTAASTKEDVKEQQKQDAKIDGLDDNDINDTVTAASKKEDVKEQRKQDAKIDGLDEHLVVGTAVAVAEGLAVTTAVSEKEDTKEQQKLDAKTDGLTTEGHPSDIPSYLIAKVKADPDPDEPDPPIVEGESTKEETVESYDEDNNDDHNNNNLMAGAAIAGGLAAVAATATTAAVVASHNKKKKQAAAAAAADAEQARIDNELATKMAQQSLASSSSSPSPSAPPHSENNINLFVVTVPAGITPGMPFKVDVGGQRFEVTCPPNARAGQNIKIALPASSGGPPPAQAPAPAPAPKSNPHSENNVNLFQVTVPAGVGPGMPFKVDVGGQRFEVTCPPNARAGQNIKIALPASSGDGGGGGGSSPQAPAPAPPQMPKRSQSPKREVSLPSANSGLQYIVVTVPAGVAAGGRFKVDVGGQRFEATCPPNACAGDQIKVGLGGDGGGGSGTSTPHSPQKQYHQHHQHNHQQHQQQHQPQQQPQPQQQKDPGLHYVIVPAGISAHMPFRVDVGGTQFNVTCPANARAGQQIAVRVPHTPTPKPAQKPTLQRPTALTSESRGRSHDRQQNHYVIVPPNVWPGMAFKVDMKGKRFRVTCPPNAKPGQRIMIALPTGSGTNHSKSPARRQRRIPGHRQPNRSLTPPRETHIEHFDVVVPSGVGPGDRFRIRHKGSEMYTVVCPPTARAGQKIRVPIKVAGMSAPKPTTTTSSSSSHNSPYSPGPYGRSTNLQPYI